VKKSKAKKSSHAGLQRVSSRPRKVVGRPFPKGVSGNPSGKRKGTVSLTASLKRLLSRDDAERIAKRLVALAKAGDLQAVKLLLDRIDGPQTGPLAIATATAQAGSEVLPEAGTAQVFIVDNGRGDNKPPFDHKGFVACARQLFGMPTGDTPPPGAPSIPDAALPASETESSEGEACGRGVIDGATFLNNE
jgi:hypothetical protein